MPAGVRLLHHEFSAESRRLFYVREDITRKLCQILERDLRTGEERELYRTSSGGEEPRGIAVSPDGKWLAVFSFNRRVLSVMPSSGGTPRLVHRFDQGRNTNPEWTHDGKYLLIGGVGGTKGILYRIPVEGGEPQEIVMQKSFDDRPSVHPDGRHIAFSTRLNYDTDADVWVMQNFLPELNAAKRQEKPQ
jgi:Tol biopolymer transport system component